MPTFAERVLEKMQRSEPLEGATPESVGSLWSQPESAAPTAPSAPLSFRQPEPEAPRPSAVPDMAPVAAPAPLAAPTPTPKMFGPEAEASASTLEVKPLPPMALRVLARQAQKTWADKLRRDALMGVNPETSAEEAEFMMTRGRQNVTPEERKLYRTVHDFVRSAADQQFGPDRNIYRLAGEYANAYARGERLDPSDVVSMPEEQRKKFLGYLYELTQSKGERDTASGTAESFGRGRQSMNEAFAGFYAEFGPNEYRMWQDSRLQELSRQQNDTLKKVQDWYKANEPGKALGVNLPESRLYLSPNDPAELKALKQQYWGQKKRTEQQMGILRDKTKMEIDTGRLRRDMDSIIAAKDAIQGRNWLEQAAFDVAEMAPLLAGSAAAGYLTGGVGATAFFVPSTATGILDELRQSGVDVDDTSRAVALMAAVPIAAVERLQFTTATKPFSEQVKKVAQAKLRERMTTFVKGFIKKQGVDYVSENFEELLQGAGEIAAKALASELQGKSIDMEAELEQLGMEMRRSAGALGLMLAPGAMFRGARGAGAALRGAPESAVNKLLQLGDIDQQQLDTIMSGQSLQPQVSRAPGGAVSVSEGLFGQEDGQMAPQMPAEPAQAPEAISAPAAPEVAATGTVAQPEGIPAPQAEQQVAPQIILPDQPAAGNAPAESAAQTVTIQLPPFRGEEQGSIVLPASEEAENVAQVLESPTAPPGLKQYAARLGQGMSGGRSLPPMIVNNLRAMAEKYGQKVAPPTVDKSVGVGYNVGEETANVRPEDLGRRTASGDAGVSGLVVRGPVEAADGGRRGVLPGVQAQISRSPEEADKLLTPQLPESLINERGTPFFPQEEWDHALRDPWWGHQRLKKLIDPRHNTPEALARLGLTPAKFADITDMARALRERAMRSMDAAEEAAMARGREAAKRPINQPQVSENLQAVDSGRTPSSGAGIYTGSREGESNAPAVADKAAGSADKLPQSSDNRPTPGANQPIRSTADLRTQALAAGYDADAVDAALPLIDAYAKLEGMTADEWVAKRIGAVRGGKDAGGGLRQEDRGAGWQASRSASADEVASASEWSDQYMPGEPGYANPSELKWLVSNQYPIKRTGSTARWWAKWFKQEQNARAEDGDAGYYDDMLSEPIREPVVIYDDGKRGYVWDGNHRMGASASKGRSFVTAIVGVRKDADKGLTQVDDSLEQRAKTVVRGKVDFDELASEGKAVIYLFEQANKSTFIHEIAHIFRRHLPAELLARAEKIYSVKDGKWTRGQKGQEERFASDFLKYLQTGKAPLNNKTLAEVFAKFKEWLTDIYGKLRGKLLAEKVKLFDEMLASPINTSALPDFSDAATLPDSAFISEAEADAADRKPYFDKDGRLKASSREVPVEGYPYKPGQWKISSLNGIYGHEIDKLVELDPAAVGITEFDYTTNENWEGRGDDARRYAEWIKEGKRPPPIRVVITDNGKALVTDGHRRLAAAKMTGNKILAWVSPTMDTGKRTTSGKVIGTGMTIEGVRLGAQEAYDRRRAEIEAEGEARAKAADAVESTDTLMQAERQRTPEEQAAAIDKAVGRVERKAEQRRRQDVKVVGGAAVRQMDREVKAEATKGAAEIKATAKSVFKSAQEMKRMNDKELLDYAKEQIPEDEYKALAGVFERIINKRARPNDRASIITAIADAQDRIDRREAMKAFRKAVSEVKAAGLRPDALLIADEILQGKLIKSDDMRRRMRELDKSAREAMGDYADRLFDAEFKQRLDVAHDILRSTETLRDVRAEDLRKLTETLNILLLYNQTKVAEHFRQMDEQHRADIAGAVADIERTKKNAKYKEDVAVPSETKRPGFFRNLASIRAREGLDNLIRSIAGDSGRMFKTVFEDLYAAAGRAIEFEDAAHNRLAERMVALGMTPKDLSRFSRSAQQTSWLGQVEEKLGRFPTTETVSIALPEATTAASNKDENARPLNSISMTRAERMTLLGWFRDPRVRDWIADGNGFRRSTNPLAGIVFLTEADMQAIEDSASPEERALVDEIVNMYATTFREALDKTNLELNGYAKPLPDRMWPVHRYGGDREQDPNSYLNAFRADFMQPRHAGTLKERTGGQAALLLTDAFDDFGQHVSQIAAYTQKQAAYDRAMRLMKNQEVNQAIVDRALFGDNLINMIRRKIERAGGFVKKDKRQGSKFLATLIRNVHGSALAWKPHVALGQMVSINKMQLEYAVPDLLNGMANVAADRGQRARRIIEAHSPTLRRRINGMGFDLLTAGTSDRQLTEALGGKSDWLSDTGKKLIQMGDNVATYTAVEAAMVEGTKRGLTGAELERFAAERATQVVRDTQATADSLTISTLMDEANDTTALKLIPGMMFNTERSKSFNLLMREFYRFRETRDYLRLARAMAVIGMDNVLYRGVKVGVGALVAGAVALAGMGGDDDDDKKDEKHWATQLWQNTLADTVGVYPVLGDLASNMTNALIKASEGRGWAAEQALMRGNPVTSNVNQAMLSAVRLTSAWYSERKLYNEVIAKGATPEQAEAYAERKRGVFQSGPRKGKSKMVEASKDTLEAVGALAGIPTPAVRQLLRPIENSPEANPLKEAIKDATGSVMNDKVRKAVALLREKGVSSWAMEDYLRKTLPANKAEQAIERLRKNMASE